MLKNVRRLQALDSKHIRIKNAALAVSLYYNYKRYFSIVLMALIDADSVYLGRSRGQWSILHCANI
jgi:hypothetical protein